jgi:hypothetical protein
MSIPGPIAVALAACGGDDTTGTPTGLDSGKSDQSSSNDTGAGADTNTPGDAGSDTADGTAPPSACGFASDSGAAFQCDNPTMCPTGAACCLLGEVRVDPACGTLLGANVKGTTCRMGGCGAGEVTVCAAVEQCGDAGICGPFKTRGKSLGACAIAPADAGSDDAGDAGACKPSTLHPTDGGVGPFCPFQDAGAAPSCSVGQVCCDPGPPDRSFCK